MEKLFGSPAFAAFPRISERETDHHDDENDPDNITHGFRKRSKDVSRSVDSSPSNRQGTNASFANSALSEDCIFGDLCHTEALLQFWHFATNERRTKSLSNRVSDIIRGEWLTPDLVIQGIHGWGTRSVRLLCVVAHGERERDRLKLFFDKDKRNVAGRLTRARDPLENENRVLVKIAYGESTSTWVEKEKVVYDQLAGLPGIPTIINWILFEDVNCLAVAYKYSSALNLQQRLETGVLIAEEDLHHMVCFLLQVVQGAHERGWIHGDLRPTDMLLDFEGVESLDDAPDHRLPLVCSWGHAVPISQGKAFTAPGALVDLVQGIPVAPPRSALRLRTEDLEELDEVGSPYLGRPGTVSRHLGLASSLPTSGRDLFDTSSQSAIQGATTSLYSAPEQLVAPFVGHSCDSPATDVYRVAAVAIMALRARGPLGAPGRATKRSAEQNIDVLRRLGHECVMKRAEGKTAATEDPWKPAEEDKEKFVKALKGLLEAQPDTKGLEFKEVLPWFKACLARDPAERIQTATDSLDYLDELWSDLEERLIQEAHVKREEEEKKTLAQFAEEEEDDLLSEPSSAGSNARGPTGRVKRIVFEPPPELSEMTVF